MTAGDVGWAEHSGDRHSARDRSRRDLVSASGEIALNHIRTTRQIETLAREFEEQGYVKVEHALSREQLTRFNAAVDRHRESHPERWVELSDSFREGTNVLPDTEDFDEAIENPTTLDILRAIIGEDITFEEFAIMLRDSTSNLGEIKGWHRDIVREYDRRMEIDAVSVMLYLSDVTENDHCFSIVPETHSRLVDVNPLDVDPGDGIDVLGPAGTAVIFHARAIHCGHLKPNSGQRRTLQAYYSRWRNQRTAEWSDIPERLYAKSDPTLPRRFYDKWNVTRILEGVGKRPADLSPDLSVSEVIQEVQRRGRAAM